MTKTITLWRSQNVKKSAVCFGCLRTALAVANAISIAIARIVTMLFIMIFQLCFVVKLKLNFVMFKGFLKVFNPNSR